MRRLVCETLQELGFRNIMEAQDGMEAMHTLRTFACDLVITDRNMPNMDGIALLQTIRADQRLRDLPVLLVTAAQERDQIMEAMQAKVNGYIVKPFTTAILQDKIHKIFLQKSLMEQKPGQS